MKRLTHYNEKDKRYDIKNAYLEDLEQDLKYDGIAWLRIYESYQELGRLEDIEEELGIDLITLFKALKDGVWYFGGQRQLMHDYVWLVNNYVSAGEPYKLSFVFKTFYENQILLFENYGKVWALTEKELEQNGR